MTPSLIKTGVDKLVDLVTKEKKVSIKDAARKLGVSPQNIEEWADFLEEEGLISVEHSLSGVSLMPKQLTKTELRSKVKEYKTEQEAFQRKVTVALTDVEREAEDIRVLRTEFKNLHKEIGDDLDQVQEELSSIDKFREYENRILKKKSDFEKEYSQKIDSMNARLNLLQKRMEFIAQTKTKKKKIVEKKSGEIESLLQKEKQLLESLKNFEKTLEQLVKKAQQSEESLVIDEKEIKDLEKLQEQYQEEIDSAQNEMKGLFSQIDEKRSEIKLLESDFLDKLKKSDAMSKTKLTNAKKVQQTFKAFFTKYDQIKQIMETLDTQYRELEEELQRLAHKAAVYDMTLKEGKAPEQVEILEQELDKLNKKRSTFKQELLRLKDVLKTRIKS